nr:PREDICTED: paralemmin-1-like [Anolis carolinensis]|eukprot:XP_008123254.1 PREDICTED: paralemmin-1-like [Anolis carolinensis]
MCFPSFLPPPKASSKASNSPVKVADGGMMKAAMYSVEITVEKDKVTGETKVLSSTTRLPKDHSVQGVKVYEDEMKGRLRPHPNVRGWARKSKADLGVPITPRSSHFLSCC